MLSGHGDLGAEDILWTGMRPEKELKGTAVGTTFLFLEKERPGDSVGAASAGTDGGVDHTL